MGFRPLSLLAVGGTIALFLGFGIAPVAAQQSFSYQTPSEYYVGARRLYPPVPGLTPTVLSANPNRYRGKTLELEGRLSGVVRAGDEGALLILNTDKYGSLTLSMSLLPNWLQPGARLRVLVVAMGADESEVVVGMPDMQVVAVASASDIRAAELRWQQTAAARAERDKQRQAAMKAANQQLIAMANRSTSGSMPRALLPSRSGGSRRSSNAPVSASGVISSLSEGAQASLPQYTGFVRQWNKRLSENEAQIIAASILHFSEHYDVDPRLMVALIIAESDFRPSTTSHKGAMGLTQLMPDEAQRLKLSNPYDPVQNIYASVFLMKERLNKYSGGAGSQALEMRHIILALASYNAGMGAVKKYGGVPPYRETQNYVKKIERIYRQLCGETNG
jgi:soluble lytic murein transglycosylase-like protein